MTDREIREIATSFERDVSGQADLFVEGKCSACGGRAQRRMGDEPWFHVNVFNAHVVQRAVKCTAPAGAAKHFVQEKSRSRRKKFVDVEPHYREITEQIMDYDNVDTDGRPAPILKTIHRPIVCTCTNPECPGWGVPLPPEIQKFRDEN